MHRLLFILAFSLAAYGITRAQNFNYSVSTGNSTWSELNSQAILNTNNQPWEYSYKIPIGFPFIYLGRTFDSVTVERNGFITFDTDRSYGFMAFNNFSCSEDGSGNQSVLGYELTGTVGSRVLTIQYKNVGLIGWQDQFISYQISLHENGIVQINVGPHELSLENPIQAGIAIGLINPNMDTETRGVFVMNNQSTISSNTVTENNPEIPSLDFIPSSGTYFRFEPIQ